MYLQIGHVFYTSVMFVIKGEDLEQFLQCCSYNGIRFWQVKKESEDKIRGILFLKDVRYLRQLRYGKKIKIKFHKKQGILLKLKNSFSKKGLIIGLISALIAVFLISNMVWKIDISGVSNGMKDDIKIELSKYDIHKGIWHLSEEKIDELKAQLAKKYKSLSWIDLRQQGSVLYFQADMGEYLKGQKQLPAQNLIAGKSGIIRHTYISQGILKVDVNETVEKGDILVSGRVEFPDKEYTKEDEDIKTVTAQGKVFAETWYKTHVTIPLNKTLQKTTGNIQTSFYIQVNGKNMPVWGFWHHDYTREIVDSYKRPLYFFGWKLPFSLLEVKHKEINTITHSRTKEEAIKIGKNNAKKQLLQSLGPKAEMLSMKVLQQRMDSGKVKLILFMTVEEDIAKGQLIK